MLSPASTRHMAKITFIIAWVIVLFCLELAFGMKLVLQFMLGHLQMSSLANFTLQMSNLECEGGVLSPALARHMAKIVFIIALVILSPSSSSWSEVRPQF